MGMYTEFHFNSALKDNTPQEIIECLQYMLGQRPAEAPLINHPFFKTTRWLSLFVSDSAYFDADTHSTLRFDTIDQTWYLCVRSNLKNYDEEIQKFIDWISPYLDKYDGDFLGFFRYEEHETPTLIYHKEGEKQ